MVMTKEQRMEEMKKQAQEIEQAYNRGYKEGYNKAFATLNENWDLVTSEAEEKGRNEAWEAIQKIMRMNLVERTNIFAGIGRSTYSVIMNMSASEAIEEIKEYEKKKQEEEQEIWVGDEVLNKWGTKGIVIEIEPQYNGTTIYSVLWRNAERKCWDKSDWEDNQVWKKTGRRFPEITEVLKKMQEGE